ncbi:hypothetical protein [Devosia alba]|uniref:hypothetical protein n=1 Tax=Devosia alba TaxID=3152360 RepID=UPI003262FBE0
MNSEDRVKRLLALDERLLYAAELATEVAIKKLEDPRTPPSAAAAIIGQVFRANGLLDAKSDDPSKLMEPHEMSSDQLNARIASLRREQQERARPLIEGAAVSRSPARPSVQAAGSSVFD